jgi:predicted naringenin-chalcone synthase
MTDPMVLFDFQNRLPEYSGTQEESLHWLAEAHIQSEFTKLPHLNEEERAEVRHKLTKLVHRIGVRPPRVENRNSCLIDFKRTNWEEMRIFKLHRLPSGVGTTERNQFFTDVITKVFDHFYSEEEIPPAALIHVTCTGYHSPSAAQRTVVKKNWGQKTEVVHAYHMGCYASIPALRISRGFFENADPYREGSRRVDIVHTELCTLHLNPTVRAPENLVVQSLFSDLGDLEKGQSGREAVGNYSKC